jgi:deoxyhypusine synthase
MKFRPIDPSRARTRKLAALSRMVARDQLGKPLKAGVSMRKFFDSLPAVLAAKELRELANSIAVARRRDRPFILLMGAHPLKVGLGPIICDLIRDGVVTAIASNGAAIIHDFELAFAGRTSEDVGAGLDEGVFGMAARSWRRGSSSATVASSPPPMPPRCRPPFT